MKFSVNWLREVVDIPVDVDELANLLTFAGVEIEGIEKRGAEIPLVVVAQINASSQHPNADRLSVCDVDDGTNHHRQIVCGAKNYKVGDKVFVALPGAALPNGLQIKVSKLRGVESQGMLCSPSEIAISADGDGLLILSRDAQIGAPIGSLFPPDTVLDVEITPNRSDLLSYVGLAREIAALLRSASFQLAVPRKEQVENLRYEGITISAPRECPFYSARRIENVKVGASPNWLRAKLESAGLRSINNIVDITNYVMLELGQPLHAFDADKLQDDINIRLAAPNEKFLALDGKNYSLAPTDLMIADADRAVAIGGVMGGEDSGVTENTRNVLLESAYFLPSSVRRTARTLNLPSDASYRFERGVDPAMTLRASERATELIRKIAGGQPSDHVAVAGEVPAPPADVTLRYARAEKLLGISLSSDQIDHALQSFGLTPIEQTADGARWKIPSYRRDLKREVDLIEEVIRLHGIDKVPSADRSRFTPQSKADRSADFATATRQRLVALGLFEARTSALIPRATAAQDGAVALRNPLSEDHVALRPSIVRGLLEVLARNLNMGATSIRLFELGKVFVPPDATEKRAVGLIFSGTVANRPHWRASEKRHLDFFDLKGAIDVLRIPQLQFRRTENSALALAAEILSGDQVVGLAGQLNAMRASEIGAKAPVFVAQVLLDHFALSTSGGPRFAEMDRFPVVTRDVAMIVPESLMHEEIARVITSANEPLLADAQVFDIFSGKEGGSVSPGRKSTAYTLTYRAKERTLTTDEVTVVHDRIRERLMSELGAELRE